MNKKYLCIYHGNCPDGFTSAWVLRNALGEENVTFYPGVYGTNPPFLGEKKFERIYMVDFSYKRETLLIYAEEAKIFGVEKIIIIDHHKTAQEDLVDLPSNVECHFDMEHSGAMLTWMYFQCKSRNAGEGAFDAVDLVKDYDYWSIDEEEAPALIQRVEDRDLWKFKFSDTRDVAAKMFSHEYTFENWDMMAELYVDLPRTTSEEVMKNVFLAEGAAIERKHFKDIKELLTVSGGDRARILGHNVPIANLPYTMSSDAGHTMCVDEKFAACYMYDVNGIVFSLRSGNSLGMDVSAIAKAFGGGGHKNAAGFRLTHAELARKAVLGEILMHYKGGTI